ncbi:RNA-directed DNA polymerase, eukaryota, reverse transcriptase zinc-binding domain protein [Tanacetum coccineum]
MEWLSEGDSNTKFFHKTVKMNLNRNRIENVEDMNGMVFLGQKVGAQFVKHFQSVFGDAKKVVPISDPSSLFYKKLSPGDAEFIVRPVTKDEIKSVFFGMNDDKAPGPDGFSSKIFKSTWSIIGDEVITKIIANRIKGFLGNIVDKCQNAFIPSRQIMDNVLLTHELMRNYHRNHGPSKVAFKIDIHKACDSMEWDFMKECLIQNKGIEAGGSVVPLFIYVSYGGVFVDG